MSEDLAYLSAWQIADSIRTKKVSAQEILNAYFERIDQHNPHINAVVWQNREAAKEFAKQCDERISTEKLEDLPPLLGVPMTVKEHFHMKGSPSSQGALAMADYRAADDGLPVQRMRAAGANIFGKTNMPFLGIDLQSFNDVYGTTLNPWNDDVSPGGSSGGSAAALSAGMTGLELGSDLGASIRYPSHCCGTFGLKPTAGVIPADQFGAKGNILPATVGVAGPMARSAKDLAVSFAALAGPPPEFVDAWELACPQDGRKKLSEFRVGVKLTDPVSDVDHTYVAALEDYVRQLEKSGAQVEHTKGPDIDGERYFDLYWEIVTAERSFNEPPEAAEIWRGAERGLTEPVNPRFWRTRDLGYQLTYHHWMKLMLERKVFRQKFDAFFSDYDVLITPVAASRAFPHDHHGQRWHRSIEVNDQPMAEMEQIFWAAYPGTVGLPAVAGPAGFIDGVPVGYQAIAGFGRDYSAMAFARASEIEVLGFTAPNL